MTNKLVTLAAIGLIGFAPTPPVQAQSASRTVSYADLDLSTPDGVAALDSRIASAIKAVCDSGDPTLRAKLAERGCRAAAVRDVEGPRAMAITGSGQVLVLNTARKPRFGR